jgi:CubicO group peptidase (beta-lactamase class C family)
MTAGHPTDSLAEAWKLEPDDLVKGFLGPPFVAAEGTRHTYDNSTSFILARMVERVTGHGLPEFLDERLFKPMGVDHADWDRVKSGAAFGFHGLHLTTEAIAAFGELLLRGGPCGDQQLVPREWVELATRRHIDCVPFKDGADDADFSCGGEVGERRRQAVHPARVKPELVATGPNRCWSWDIERHEALRAEWG